MSSHVREPAAYRIVAVDVYRREPQLLAIILAHACDRTRAHLYTCLQSTSRDRVKRMDELRIVTSALQSSMYIA